MNLATGAEKMDKTFVVKNLATLSVYYSRQNENVSPLLKYKICALQGRRREG
jgi:hypothetical protein